MLSRKSRLTVLSSAVAVGTLISAQASVSFWSADSGLRPDQLTPYWTLHDDSPATPPIVTNGVMTSATMAKVKKEYFHTGPAGLDMPSDLTIEFKARFVSRVVSANNYSPMSVYFSFGDGLGGMLNLGLDDVWLAGGHNIRGVGASVDTDNAFHTYRIQLGGTSLGSSINVYYDNAVTPLLTGAVIYDPNLNCEDAEIGFGDVSTKDSGTSEWEYLWHNASCVPINAVPEPTSAALLLAGAFLLGSRKLRRN